MPSVSTWPNVSTLVATTRLGSRSSGRGFRPRRRGEGGRGRSGRWRRCRDPRSAARSRHPSGTGGGCRAAAPGWRCPAPRPGPLPNPSNVITSTGLLRQPTRTSSTLRSGNRGPSASFAVYDSPGRASILLMGVVMGNQVNDTDDLLRRAAAGESAALAELFSRYRGRLRQMVRLRLDRRLQGRVDPSDVLQEAYIDLTQQLPAYLAKPDMPFFLWLRLLTGQRLMRLHRQHL